MRRLMVTGSSGLLGAELVRQAERAYEVTALCHQYRPPATGCRPVVCDLTDRAATLACLEEAAPELIIHCAAVADPDRCEVDPAAAERLNVEATTRVAQWAGSHGVRCVFISTDAVFDGTAGSYRETDRANPVNTYARTKWLGEQCVQAWAPEALIIRTTFYGWGGQRKPSFGEWVLQCLLAGVPLRLFTDVRISPLVVTDLAAVVLALASAGAAGLYHVAARDACSKYQFGLLLGEIFSLPTDRIVPSVVEEASLRARRPKDTSLAVEKAAAALRRPLPSVREGLAAFRNQWKQQIAVSAV